MTRACPICGCTDARGGAVHAIAVALAEDELDRAIGLGLLEAVPCASCGDGCTTRLVVARDARRAALAARERYRARQARLQRRAQERADARAVPPPVQPGTTAKPNLPSAAAAALARAKARAAERRKP